MKIVIYIGFTAYSLGALIKTLLSLFIYKGATIPGVFVAFANIAIPTFSVVSLLSTSAVLVMLLARGAKALIKRSNETV